MFSRHLLQVRTFITLKSLFYETAELQCLILHAKWKLLLKIIVHHEYEHYILDSLTLTALASMAGNS
jgi:hypothetical protein